MAGKKKEVVVNAGAIDDVENGGDVIEVDTKEVPLHVDVDTSIEDVVECVKKGKEIVFDAEDLPDFSEEEVKELPYGVAKDFFKALDIKKSYEKRKNPLSVSIIGNILGGNSLSRLESVRSRVGWHQTWKRDDELDEALAAGYVQIREKGNPDEKVGQETGAVIQIKRDGKVELIAMEIRQEIADRHWKAVAEKSQSAYKNMKEDFREKVEEINISVGGTKKDPTILVVDKEGEDD